MTGLFDGANHAEQALNDLKAAGFSPEQVSVVAKDTGPTRSMVESSDMEGAETTGAGTGALLGGLGGGALGWLVGIGALAIPGIGPVVAAGALATTLGGAAVGALAGGLIGALAGAGVPEEDARDYQEHVRQGSVLLTISAADATQAGQAREVFDRRGGAKVGTYAVDDRQERARDR
ncbi:MAG: general stress protein [Chloroflexota bacterium]|nr:general stress protein [Chloroflexota bacterium]